MLHGLVVWVDVEVVDGVLLSSACGAQPGYDRQAVVMRSEGHSVQPGAALSVSLEYRVSTRDLNVAYDFLP